MLHALRQSAHRTGRLLLPLLLLSWLSLVCGHCVALAGPFDGAPVGHHEVPAPEHDCCPPAEADPCQGGDCEHGADVQPVPAGGIKVGDQSPLLLALTLPEAPARNASAALPRAPGHAPDLSRPLYLRNCVFLI